MTTSPRTVAGIAAAAALIALSGATVSSPAFAQGTQKAEAVHCYGVNACKGMSDCKTAKNDCKGMNSCKGQGFKEMTAEQCTAKGGSLTAPAG